MGAAAAAFGVADGGGVFAPPPPPPKRAAQDEVVPPPVDGVVASCFVGVPQPVFIYCMPLLLGLEGAACFAWPQADGAGGVAAFGTLAAGRPWLAVFLSSGLLGAWFALPHALGFCKEERN